MKKLIKFLIIYLSRRDWHKEKIEKYQRRFLYVYSTLFILSAFSYDFYSDGFIVGGVISFNLIPFLIEILIFGIITFTLYLYNDLYASVVYEYKKIISGNEKIICAYPDAVFENIVYDVKYTTYYGKHIEYDGSEIYRLNDWKIFKFVLLKESRKLKLEKLMGKVD